MINSKKEKKRNPNIDFLRIISMLSIIIHHLLIHGQVLTKYKKYKIVQLFNVSNMWHICNFGIVSGLVGNQNQKFSNLFHLWIIVEFYSLLFYLKSNKLSSPIINQILISNLFPVIFMKYWYFTAYFGIYPFLPLIDSGMSSLSQIRIKKIFYFIIGIFSIWSFYFRDPFLQNRGYTPFSLLCFYIYGSYISKYIFFRKNEQFNRFIISGICFTIFIGITCLIYFISIRTDFSKVEFNIINIFKIEKNSFPVILQAISITILVSQINFGKFIPKIITFIAPLTFDIYLIHDNSYIRRDYIRNIFNNVSQNSNLRIILMILAKKSFLILLSMYKK